MQGTNPLTMQCTYITPCGWCTRQNKECDIRVIEKKKKSYGDLFKPCHGCMRNSDPKLCKECSAKNGYKHYMKQEYSR